MPNDATTPMQTAAREGDRRDEVARLLALGGDSRLESSDGGLNRYGCRFRPEPELLQLASCTGSTISELGFAAAVEADARAESGPRRYERIRRRLHELLLGDGDADVVLTPSGTDAEYVPLVLTAAGHRDVLNIVTAPTEVGSGTARAAAGLAFDASTPDGGSAVPGEAVAGFDTARIEVQTIPIRDPAGGVLEPDTIDESVAEAVHAGRAGGRDVIVHVVAHSKTGVHAPSLDALERLERRHGEHLHVVVDAAQGRISRQGLREALRRDRIVILTGSKFYGGPPFSGSVIVPRRYRELATEVEWPSGLRAFFTADGAPGHWSSWRRAFAGLPSNEGLALRWTAALAEIEAYYEIPAADRLDVLKRFERLAGDGLATSPAVRLLDDEVAARPDSLRLLESNQTVFSFEVHDDGRRLEADELRVLQQRMRTPAEDRSSIQIGQPVVIGADGRAVLRVALGGVAMREYASLPEHDRSPRIISDLRTIASAITDALEGAA